jgi:DNA-binding CsgD family transcriptional regulator/tetratricopeptide (TPR) repeat protein
MELLERASQLENLGAALRKVESGEGSVALVYGEAGIGKTSLVEQFIKANEKSWRILSGACDLLFTPRPLGPLRDIALQTHGELLSLFESEASREAIFSACLSELRSQPTIVVIEDIHWADEATFDLLKYLSRRIRQTSALLLLTYRDDGAGADHPLRLLLGDLASSHRLHRIPLASLSREVVSELAKTRSVDGNELFRLTNGNPFFVTEVLAGGTGIPETVRDVVLARAARLSTSAHRVLEAAAVIGVRAESWLLSQVAANDAESIGECVSGGMLQPQGQNYAFHHELARQIIVDAIDPRRKTALHRLTLAALKDSPDARHDLARLANHAEGTGDPQAVLKYAAAAARQASAASAHREAAALYELTLRYAGSLSDSERAQTLEAYAIELAFGGRMTERGGVLQEAVDLRDSIGDRLRQGANLASLALNACLLGQNPESEQASQAAISILEMLPPSAELAEAYLAQCYIRMEHGDFAQSLVAGEKAIALAETFGEVELVARVYNYMGSVTMAVDYERGRALLERSLSIAKKADLPFALAGALTNLVEKLIEVYELDDAERFLAKGISYATEHDDDYHLQQMLVCHSTIRFYRGDWSGAREIARKVLLKPQLDVETRTYALLALARAGLRAGDAEAWPVLGEAVNLAEDAGSLPRLGAARASWAEARWIAGHQDDIPGGIAFAYQLALSKDHPWFAGQLAFWRWRAGEEFTPPEWIARPFALHIAGNWRGAAEEWERRGCPYEQAMALMDGDEAAQFAALELFEHLGAYPIIEKLRHNMRAAGVRSIPRGPTSATRGHRFGLTSRELEVLSCLGKGSSNTIIARELSLSTRTVEHHIASILQKMGVQSRAEVVAVALKEGLLPPG